MDGSSCVQECMQKCGVSAMDKSGKLPKSDQDYVKALLEQLRSRGSQIPMVSGADLQRMKDKIVLAVQDDDGKEGYYGMGHPWMGYGHGLGLSGYHYPEANYWGVHPQIWYRPGGYGGWGGYGGFGGGHHYGGMNHGQNHHGAYGQHHNAMHGHRHNSDYGHMGGSRHNHQGMAAHSLPGAWAKHAIKGGKTVHIFMRDDPSHDHNYGHGRQHSVYGQSGDHGYGYGHRGQVAQGHLGGYGHTLGGYGQHNLQHGNQYGQHYY